MGITMDVYAPAVTPAKRRAQGKSGHDAAGQGQKDGLIVVCPHCVPGEEGGFRQVLYFVGVPTTDIFEPVMETTSEATLLYELCASVLK
jgi:hypothetical protein